MPSQVCSMEVDTSHSLSQCMHLKRLVGVMKQTLKCDETVMLIDDFCHLLSYHNTDDDFEFIHNYFTCICNINSCDCLDRNSRNRDNNAAAVLNEYSMRQQIIDKIHCYYVHSFTLGHRLSSKERSMINNDDSDDNGVNECCDKYLISKKLLKMRQLLRNKYIPNGNKRIHAKYNQLHQEIVSKNNKSNKLYQFGQVFHYASDNSSRRVRLTKNMITVSPKYASLKEEFLNNIFVPLNVEQFDNEYHKALIHFVSEYFRTHKKRIFA
eukprot:899621_1